MIIYSSLFIGRFLEALIVEIFAYNFFFVQSKVNIREFGEHCIKGVKKNKCIVFGFIFLTIYISIHSLSVPGLGIALEIRHGKGVDCHTYPYYIYTLYWILDTIRYLYDIGVRLSMLLATIAIGRFWTEPKRNENAEDADKRNENAEDPDKRNENAEDPDKEPETYSDYLQDRRIVNWDHKERSQDYSQRGSKVETISEIFQTWFILPWIMFFIGSSLDTDHILQSWMDGPSGDGKYDFSEISYMVYNFNQLFLLLLPFLCSKKINTHHSKYIYRSRKKQLDVHKSASRMALASIQKIEKDDHFDFVPRIWGTSIKIRVDDPLYIIFLLVSIFFTVIEALI